MKWSSEVERGPAGSSPAPGRPGPTVASAPAPSAAGTVPSLGPEEPLGKARPWIPAAFRPACPSPETGGPGAGVAGSEAPKGSTAPSSPRGRVAGAGPAPEAWQEAHPFSGGIRPRTRPLTRGSLEGDRRGGPAPADIHRPAAREQARRWLARARRAAVRHLERARREAEALRTQAYEEGMRRGQVEGLARWEAALRDLDEQAARQRDALMEAYRRLLAASAEPVLDLVLALARRVAGEYLATDPVALRGQIEAALARLGADGARVLVHPESLAQLEGTAPLAPGVELVADLTLAPGDFRVETPRGHIDGRVGVQIERLGRALRESGAERVAGIGRAVGAAGGDDAGDAAGEGSDQAEEREAPRSPNRPAGTGLDQPEVVGGHEPEAVPGPDARPRGAAGAGGPGGTRLDGREEV